jgi:hypothetical protein
LHCSPRRVSCWRWNRSPIVFNFLTNDWSCRIFFELWIRTFLISLVRSFHHNLSPDFSFRPSCLLLGAVESMQWIAVFWPDTLFNPSVVW